MRATAPSKPWPMITVHWLSSLLVVFMFVAVWWREVLDEDAPLAKQLLLAHKQIGMIILLLLCVRLVIRGITRPSSEDMPAWLVWASRLGHWGLYAALLAMPMLGWAMSDASGHPVQLLGMLPLPHLVGIDPDLADSLQEWHEDISWLLLTLVVMHVLAALWHHFIRKDNTLISMAPWLRR